MSDFVFGFVLVALAGGLGGFIARVVPNGLGKSDVPTAPTEAGWIVTTLAGSVAAVAAWLADDRLSAVDIHAFFVGPIAATAIPISIGDVVQAFAIGLIGLKWLVNFQESRTLRLAVAHAATKPADPQLAAKASSARARDLL